MTKRMCGVGCVAAALSLAGATGPLAETGVQTGTGTLPVAIEGTSAGKPVTVTATGRAKVELAGYMRLMICVNGRACGQGAAFWGGGPREIEAKARCAFTPGSAQTKVVIRAKSCSARLPDTDAALTGEAKPGADKKLLDVAFRGDMTCKQVLAAAEKFCCDFKKRYKSPHGC